MLINLSFNPWAASLPVILAPSSAHTTTIHDPTILSVHIGIIFFFRWQQTLNPSKEFQFLVPSGYRKSQMGAIIN
jgi:hypothetical protein